MVVVAKNKRLSYLLAYLIHQYSQYDKPRASLNTLLSQLATQHPSNKVLISKYNILLARERAVSRRRRHRSHDCACGGHTTYTRFEQPSAIHRLLTFDMDSFFVTCILYRNEFVFMLHACDHSGRHLRGSERGTPTTWRVVKVQFSSGELSGVELSEVKTSHSLIVDCND